MNFQKLLVTLFFVALTATTLRAQQRDSLLVQLATKWQNAKAYTMKIAALMPEEDFLFKPMPDEMSFGEQLLHIANNITWLSSSYLFAVKREAAALSARTATKTEIIETVGAAYDSALSVHLNLKAAQLDEIAPFFAGPKTRRQILILLHDHQTHHVGQLIVYLRLRGIKPPPYVGW